MEQDNRWFAFLTRHSGVEYDTREDHEAQTLLSRVGYRGTTSHATRNEAKAAAESMLDAVTVLDPTLGWMGIWYSPRDFRGPSRQEAGCYFSLRGPVKGEE